MNSHQITKGSDMSTTQEKISMKTISPSSLSKSFMLSRQTKNGIKKMGLKD